MSVRFGVSPIAWANDDMPELGANVRVETILADAAAIGFSGIELGSRFPREPEALAALLGPHGLDLIGGWYSTRLLVRTAADEIAALQPHLALLKALGAGVFIAAETSNAVHGDRARPLAETPRLAAGDWAGFGERMGEVARYVEGEGLRLAYHFHLGTCVETADDLGRFLAATLPIVGLVVDTGHAALGGIDAEALIRQRPERVAHVHAKDVRRAEFETVLQRRRSFLDGVLGGMFTAPGDGDLDFGGTMRALAAIGYGGWIVVEAEQDPERADPRVYGRLGLETLRRAAAKAGLADG